MTMTRCIIIIRDFLLTFGRPNWEIQVFVRLHLMEKRSDVFQETTFLFVKDQNAYMNGYDPVTDIALIVLVLLYGYTSWLMFLKSSSMGFDGYGIINLSEHRRGVGI